MAENVIGYVKKRGRDSLFSRPFGEVDSLVLSQLAYLKYDGMVPGVCADAPWVSLPYLAGQERYPQLFADARYRDVNESLFLAALESRRFGRMRLNYYENRIDEVRATQFSAVTFLLEDGTVFLAFRGTDETLAGWKEDFHMALCRPVPGQLLSACYTACVARRFAGEFRMGGHSKGGNFAVFAAMASEPRLRARIRKIYSHDGPGFRPEVLEPGAYEAVRDKICHILPAASVVGVLFRGKERCKIVRCRKRGLRQHNPYHWRIRGCGFLQAGVPGGGRRRRDEALNAWILSLPEERLALFVESLFQILEASESDNLIDMAAEWKKSAAGMRGAWKAMDRETRRLLTGTIRQLVFTICSHSIPSGR